MFKSATQPLCRYCGEAIRKHTTTVHIERERQEYHRADEFSRHVYPETPIKSKAECAKLTNHAVMSVKWNRAERSTDTGYERQPELDYIGSFTEWDSESYVDAFFCNGDHAKRFAYVLARAGHQTQASADAHKAPA